MDNTADDPAAIFHALANTLNGIIVTLQLQERYLARDTEQMRELISDTSNDLKHEIKRSNALLTNCESF